MVEKKPKTEEAAKFKGKFIEAIGRRKAAVARVRLYKAGKGAIVVNAQPIEKYLSQTLVNVAVQPLRLAGLASDLDVSVVVRGGGKQGQADAIRHGIARTLLEINQELQPSLRAKGYLTRDSRIKERKKPGLKKARRAPQWAKR